MLNLGSDVVSLLILNLVVLNLRSFKQKLGIVNGIVRDIQVP